MKIITRFRTILKINEIFLNHFQIKSLSTSLKTYDVNTPLFKSIISPELVSIKELFSKYGFELRIAGGAVRDLLMKIQPHDVDLATNAFPDQMLHIFKKENIRIFNLNGIKHGTVTIRINEKSNFEITTLRIDEKCYGRKAEVRFTNDWNQDAIRRDLTINSLFLDFDGIVYDFVGGYEDLKNRVVKFVGVPDNRVKEDYLRILRYFRFFSRVSNDPSKHDEASMRAIKENVEGLKSISKERKAVELRKILTQKFSDKFIEIFYEFKISEAIGLPKSKNIHKYAEVYNYCFELKPNPMTMIFSLLENQDDIKILSENLKLSREETYLLYALNKYVPLLKLHQSDKKAIEFMRREFVRSNSNINRPLKKKEAIEIAKYCNRSNLIESIQNINISKFDVNPFRKKVEDYLNENNDSKNFEKLIKSKRFRFNYLTNDLREKWIDSNFTLTHEELINSLTKDVLDSYIVSKKKKTIL